jgi:hypothetical protein
MRGFLLVSILTMSMGALPPIRAAEKEDAAAILEKAIKAHGGAEALARAAQSVRKGGGTITSADQDLSFTDEFVCQLPERLRLTVDVANDKQKARFLVVINGKKGWETSGGIADELTEARLGEEKDEAFAQWVALVYPLKKDAGIELATLPGKKVNERQTVGLKVTKKDMPEIRLFFDADTGLLLKMERKARIYGKEMDRDYLFDDYKETDGGKLPMHISQTLNGKKFIDLKVSSYEFPKQIEESTFSKP